MPIKIFVALIASIFKALRIKVDITSKDFDVASTVKGLLIVVLILLTSFLSSELYRILPFLFQGPQ